MRQEPVYVGTRATDLEGTGSEGDGSGLHALGGEGGLELRERGLEAVHPEVDGSGNGLGGPEGFGFRFAELGEGVPGEPSRDAPGLLPGSGSGSFYRGCRASAEPQCLGRLEPTEIPEERGQEVRDRGLCSGPSLKPPTPEASPEEELGRHLALGGG